MFSWIREVWLRCRSQCCLTREDFLVDVENSNEDTLATTSNAEAITVQPRAKNDVDRCPAVESDRKLGDFKKQVFVKHTNIPSSSRINNDLRLGHTSSNTTIDFNDDFETEEDFVRWKLSLRIFNIKPNVDLEKYLGPDYPSYNFDSNKQISTPTRSKINTASPSECVKVHLTSRNIYNRAEPTRLEQGKNVSPRHILSPSRVNINTPNSAGTSQTRGIKVNKNDDSNTRELVLNPNELLNDLRIDTVHPPKLKTKKERSKKSHYSFLVAKNDELIQKILAPIGFCKLSSLYVAYPILNKTTFNRLTKKLMSNKKFNQFYRIKKIEQVMNPFLYAHYQLKSLKAKEAMQEIFLYHGTKPNNLDSILSGNFNWRYTTDSKYGFGVYFANNPWFASHYSKNNSNIMVMIVAKVLVGKYHVGNQKTQIPFADYDTTVSPDNQQYVKYDDDSFYPEFVFYFEETLTHRSKKC